MNENKEEVGLSLIQTSAGEMVIGQVGQVEGKEVGGGITMATPMLVETWVEDETEAGRTAVHVNLSPFLPFKWDSIITFNLAQVIASVQTPNPELISAYASAVEELSGKGHKKDEEANESNVVDFSSKTRH